uniref:Reverse transcriptase domain-containing protein n=1 Tax=Tanacetum cinerariifolium TaxID=118510 RepID=A0A6L2MZT6_TANCI|nr:reverse transcriptase domain-containing protein [Tanacetum cinerariifolium]
MSTRSSARNLFPPLDNPEITIRRRSRVDPTLLNDFEMATDENGDPLVPDLRTMEELCQPSLNGRDFRVTMLISILTILHVTQSIKVNGVTDDALHLYLFPHSLTHHATTWFDCLPRNPLNTFEQMAKMFLGKYFPPSMVTKLRNEITNFRQRLDESLFEAWDRYKLSIDQCPNHNMLPVTQIYIFYNGLTLRHCDTINAAAGGTLMKRHPEECYDLIENMTAHHNDWDTSAQQSESSSSITSFSGPKIVALKAKMEKINKNLMRVLHVNQQVKAITPNCETSGGPHSYNDCPATIGQIQNVYARRVYQGGNSYQPQVESETEVTKDPMHPTNNRRTKEIQPLVVQVETPNLNFEPVVAPIIKPITEPVSALKPKQKPLIPYPSRLHDQKLRDKANDQKEKFFQIFQDLNFNISFTVAFILMPKFGPTTKTLLTNKDKLSELARTPLNEHCSAVILKKLLEKLGDPDNVEQASLPELSPMYMTLKLFDRSISHPVRVAEDVFVKVGTFHFPADFVVVDFDADHRVPLILGRSFLKTERPLIDVFEGELTPRIGKKSITFNLNQTSRYSANYNDMTANRIDVIDMACEEYSQEVLSFSDVIASGNLTPYYDPIISTSSLTLTPFGDSDFLLEEVDAFLALKDDPTSPEVDHSYFDTEGDILLLRAFLNDDPSLTPPTQEKYLLQVRKELKICEAKNDKSSIDEPPEVELKDLPPHLEYTFLEGDYKLPVIIAKDLSDEEKTALIKILMEDDFKPVVQHQRRVNPKIYDVIKKEVKKLLDAGLIYPISDSPWVSPVHCVPKKGGFTVVENEENELIPTQLVMRWHVCIDNHQEKTTFTCPYGKFTYRRMPFRLCNAPGVFTARKPLTFSRLAIMDPPGDIMARTTLTKRCLTPDSIGPQSTVMPKTWSNLVTLVNVRERFRNVMKCLKIPSKFVRFLTFGASISWGCSRLHEGTSLEPPVPSLVITIRTSAMTNSQRSCLTFKTPIGCTPYKLVYGKSCHLPIELEHKAYWALKHAKFDLQTTDDHRKVQINDINKLHDQAYENSLIYKEKTKRLHDSKIKDRVFNVGDRVLLFNSRLKIFLGKLKTCWSGPFTITQVFPYGTVELSQADGPNFKVNGHRLKHYFGEDIPKMVVSNLQTFPKDK